MAENWRPGYEADLRDTRWGIWKAVKVFLPLVVALVVVFGAIGHSVGWFSEAATTAQETFGPQAAVQKYEWFEAKYAEIQATDGRIAQAVAAAADFSDGAGPRAEWKYGDREEHARLASVALGLRNYRQSLVGEYNAAARMVTRSVFKSGALPERIDY